MIVVNISVERVLVGDRYLLPRERREVSRRDYERAKANHPAALQELGATPPAPRQAETPAEEKAKSKNTRRKKNVTETETESDAASAVADDGGDAGAGPGD